MPQPISVNVQRTDLTARFPYTTTVAASPSAATETTIASLNIPLFGDTPIVTAVILNGWAAYTVGGSGSAVNLRIRQTNSSGTVIATTGAMTGSQHGAGILSEDCVAGVDATPGVGVYVLTMTVTAGASPSTVSAVLLSAVVI